MVLRIGMEGSFLFEMHSTIIFDKRSYSAVLLEEQLIDHRFTYSGPLVLGIESLNSTILTVDRNQTVSRRSKPSSGYAFIGEQPNPWNLLQLQDAYSRHRGAKQFRR